MPDESPCCGADVVNVGGILGLMGQIFNKNFDKEVEVLVCDSCSKVLKCECHRPVESGEGEG